MRRKPTYSGPYRVDPQPSLDFSGELIVDLFAGGGGASTGMEWALGRSPDIAVNHDPEAVALHQVNHPHTLHLCESVFDVVPQEVCAGRPVGYLWMSPDCKHFSKAKGSKPVSKRIRGLAWVGKRWAATVRPRVIFLENVEEFKTWGPLVKNGSGEMVPCKKRSGRTFRNFVRELQRLGYNVDWREMRACDYGAPTIRKRLFLVARCDGEPICWPEPTHGDPKTLAVQAGELKPWRTAAECIDWSIPCPSIFERKRPLAENTLRRIARGIQRYVIDNPEPFIVPIAHYNGSNPAHSTRIPLRTVTANPKGGAFAVVAPSISTYYGPKGGNHHRGASLDEPLRTQTTENRHALQSAMLLKHYGGVVGTPVDVPAGTITTQDHHAIAAAHMVRHFGESVGSSATEPVGTITAGGMGKTAVSTATLIRNFGTSNAADVEAPHLTITGKQKDGLVTSNLIKLRGTCKDGQRTDAPMPTITASGTHVADVRAFLMKYYGNEKEGVDMLGPLHTVTTKDRFGLVTVNGILHEIVDIGMRMLAPRELYTAQGFPPDYVISYVVIDGKTKPLSVTAQVRMVGNSVSPYNAAALVRANLRKQMREAA
jgi:DNA (cytosine-5)-methyltransferase 1